MLANVRLYLTIISIGLRGTAASTDQRGHWTRPKVHLDFSRL